MNGITLHRRGLLLCAALTSLTPVYSQKFGYVDAEYILNQLPEYGQALDRLDSLAQEWQGDVDQKYAEVEKMKLEVASEDVLLTKEMREERNEKLKEKVTEAQELQQETFGYEGLYFLKRAEMTQEIQDKVFEAIEKVAKKHKLQIVFDKSGELVMLYTNPVHDYTDFVLEEMGLLKEKEERKKAQEREQQNRGKPNRDRGGNVRRAGTGDDGARPSETNRRQPPTTPTQQGGAGSWNPGGGGGGQRGGGQRGGNQRSGGGAGSWNPSGGGGQRGR